MGRKKRVGICGFGRIGRSVLKAMFERNMLKTDLEVTAVVEVNSDADYLAYQLRHDSVHGEFPLVITTKKSNPALSENDLLVIYGNEIKCLPAAKSPSEIIWGDYRPDYVIESSGKFNNSKDAGGHWTAGVKKVIVTGPADNVKTIVVGVNEDIYLPDKDRIISCATCTSNCLAPPVRVLLDSGLRIKKGYMATIHAYTGNQPLVDGPSKKDWRGGRAGAQNIIPSSTGAAKVIGKVVPEVAGKFTCVAYRVPVIDVSMIDLVLWTENDTRIQDVDAILKNAADNNPQLAGVLSYTEEPLVSSDFIHNSHSSIYDSSFTIENNLEGVGNSFRIVAWYDNEWGYSNRVCDMLEIMINRS